VAAAAAAALMERVRYCIWGSELSPFSLKLRALFDFAELSYAWLPANGGRLQNYRVLWRINRATRQHTALRYPQLTELDEYPLVPFLVDDQQQVFYDSSALAHWIDDHYRARRGALFPSDPGLCFVAQLIDEAFDEFGLYMVHHNRWVMSATTNDAGARLAREFKRVLPPGAGARFAQRFARRQVRRLPYLFSVAPPGFVVPGLSPELKPPSRDGFPETHELLTEAWDAYLGATETVLTQQPYLLGERFTVADASAYGQLGMNLKDPTTAEQISARAPTTYRWLCSIRDGQHSDGGEALYLSEAVQPLLDIIGRTFVRLMRQNEVAYEAAVERGERVFNEHAFDQGKALYDGELLGRPFRSVAKSFQVRVWREIKEAWQALPAEARDRITPLLGA
jgi:glutathione S-transferase